MRTRAAEHGGGLQSTREPHMTIEQRELATRTTNSGERTGG